MSGAIDLAALAKNPAVFNVIYPVGEQYKFDNEYYLKKHMPLVKETWGAHGLTSYKIIQLEPSTGYQMQAVLVWESVEKMTAAIQNTELATKVMGDIPNFTNAQPLRLLGAEIGSG